MPTPPEHSEFREEVCIPMLVRAQNSDGGWGYQPGKASGTEATAWAVLALGSPTNSGRFSAAIEAGKNWLRGAQRPDHSWPSFPAMPEGCWLTSLACLALLGDEQSQAAVRRGVKWLANQWPGDSTWWRSTMTKLFAKPGRVRQDSSLRGWSWTPGTSSWVEPTACALVLFDRVYDSKKFPPDAEKRRALAEALLYDRMCAGGGWNSGNPEVYGVAGEPLVGPTAWALIALQRHRDRAENRAALAWLLSVREKIEGPASQALAHIAYAAYGADVPSIVPALRRAYAENQFLGSVLAAAASTVALDAPAGWFAWEGKN